MAQQMGTASARTAPAAKQPAETFSPREFAVKTLDLVEQYGCQPTPQAYELFFAYAADHPPEIRDIVDEAAGEKKILRTFDLERIHLEHFRSSDADWALQENAAEIVETSLTETTSLLDRNLLNGRRFDREFKSASSYMSAEEERDKMRVFVDSMLLQSSEIHRAQLEIATQISMMRDKLVSVHSDVKSTRQESQKDGLTGLWNRRHFDTTLRREVTEAVEQGTPLSLSLMCVDGFEDMIQRITRPVGDALLRLLGGRIIESAGKGRLAARFGNEYFAILSPGGASAGAYDQAERLRDHIAKKNFSVRGSSAEIGTMTISCAVCTLKPQESMGAFQRRVLEMLSDAQFQGGDIVLK